MTYLFWLSLFGVVYGYFLYPLVLIALSWMFKRPVQATAGENPAVSIIIPVYNEKAVIGRKLDNLLSLDYRKELIQIIVVSDGSTDGTVDVVRSYFGTLDIRLLEVTERKGKANALNTGVAAATSDILVFTDASIMLEADALTRIVMPLSDPRVGCVSGQDLIPGGGGEGLYGRYELFLRHMESQTGSIVGASGSFYAQRKALCEPFLEGMAPDFLSVLSTVEKGYRAVSEPRAVGYMSSVKSTSQEFDRKVRTVLRGMTALLRRTHLLNPFRYGLFSYFLISHKIVRWLIPVMLAMFLASNVFILGEVLYNTVMALQIAFYLAAAGAYPQSSPLHEHPFGRIPLFFVMANLAIAVAWLRYLRGDRQELWTPTKRQHQ